MRRARRNRGIIARVSSTWAVTRIWVGCLPNSLRMMVSDFASSRASERAAWRSSKFCTLPVEVLEFAQNNMFGALETCQYLRRWMISPWFSVEPSRDFDKDDGYFTHLSWGAAPPTAFHFWHTIQYVFYFDTWDILAARDDDVFELIHNFDATIGYLTPKSPVLKPATVKDGFCGWLCRFLDSLSSPYCRG